MNATDRLEAEKLFSALLAGFDRKATPERLEAYWRGCNRMSLPLLDRVVDRALGDHGPDEIPAPKRLWGIARDLRAEGAPPRAGNTAGAHDQLSVLGNVILLRVLMRDPASDDSLRRMVAAKNRIVEQVQGTYGTRPLTDEEVAELRDVFTAALEKLWQPRTSEETAADFEHFARTGRVRDAQQTL